ncbi:MAG: hypothetical protein KF751_16285 [Nitrospira sp.]|nr:hypothetical protein [Nitrospira sp.]
MIADLKPYPDYKESGLPWLGQVPSSWRVVRNGSLFGQRNETGYGELPILEVSLKTGIRVRNFENSARKQVMSDKGKYKRAGKGDLAYNMMRMWQGAVGVSPVDGLVSPAYVVARPYPDVESKFFVALFRTGDYMSEIDSCSRGIVKDRNRLYWGDFKQILSPCPSPEEQAAIVRFLDWANGRLERAIRAKRKVIALLNEQKQAIIHRAVTRGLPSTGSGQATPSVPLKPSGIPWLGDIPQHWEVRPLKQLLVKMDYGTSENVRGEGRVRVLTMGHIRDGKIVLPETGGLNAVPPGLLLEKNDLLFNRTNSPALVGKVGLFAANTNEKVTFASYLVRLRVRSEHNPIWLNYLLNSTVFWSYARSQALVSLHQANLNSKRYGQMVLPVPTERAEQDKLVEHVRLQADEIERAIDRLEREIELLREYRTRLVADVVTGKLDVRTTAAKLPEEENDPEPLDDANALDERGEDEEHDGPDAVIEEAEA